MLKGQSGVAGLWRAWGNQEGEESEGLKVEGLKVEGLKVEGLKVEGRTAERECSGGEGFAWVFGEC